MEAEDLPHANIIKRIKEKLSKSHDKSTREKDHDTNDNIENGIYAYEGSISVNNGVQVEVEQVIENDTEKFDSSKDVQKIRYLKGITTEKNTPRETLTIKESG